MTDCLGNGGALQEGCVLAGAVTQSTGETGMTEAPERIWAWAFPPQSQDDATTGAWHKHDPDIGFEYVRADKAQALVEQLRRHHEYHSCQDGDAIAWGVDPQDTYTESEFGKATAAALAAFTDGGAQGRK